VTSLTPPGDSAHGFQYSPVGLVKQYNPPGIPGAKPTKYFYNSDRQLDSIVRPDSITVALSYDSAGRNTGVIFDRGTLTLGYSVTTGNLTKIRTPEGDSLVFSYDGSLPTQVRWAGLVDGTVGVAYDRNFRVIGEAVNGDTVAFGYDTDGLLTSAGSLILGRSATNGLLLADTLGEIRSAYQYSSRGELKGYRVLRDTTKLFATGYIRDSLGRIVQLFDTTQGTPTRWSFVYDSVGRLVKDSVNGAVFHAFTYDANGNRLTLPSGSGTVTYSYDPQDRLRTAVSGSDTTRYAYGSNGELKTKTVPGVGTTTYTYDALGNLLTVVLPDSTEIEYVIDGRNRRLGRKVNGVLVQGWLYRSQVNPVAELDSGGDVVSRFVYGSRRNVPDYMLKGGNVYRLVADHLGSVRLVVDTATGMVAQRIDYDEWGNITQNTNPTFQPFGFGGGLVDDSTELTRFGARDYDALVGRWTAKEPIRFAGGETGLYVYATNDPLGALDPSGLFTVQVGYTVNVTFFFISVTTSVSVAVDFHGNATILATTGGGKGYGVKESAGWTVAVSNAVTVCDLTGPFNAASIGGGTGFGGSVDSFSGLSDHGWVNGEGMTVGQAVGAGGFVGATGTSRSGVLHLW
jgi:RHS repeat-associated protein